MHAICLYHGEIFKVCVIEHSIPLPHLFHNVNSKAIATFLDYALDCEVMVADSISTVVFH